MKSLKFRQGYEFIEICKKFIKARSERFQLVMRFNPRRPRSGDWGYCFKRGRA